MAGAGRACVGLSRDRTDARRQPPCQWLACTYHFLHAYLPNRVRVRAVCPVQCQWQCVSARNRPRRRLATLAVTARSHVPNARSCGSRRLEFGRRHRTELHAPIRVPAPLHPPVNPMVLDAEHLLNELNQVRSPPAAGRSVVDEEGRAPWLPTVRAEYELAAPAAARLRAEQEDTLDRICQAQPTAVIVRLCAVSRGDHWLRKPRSRGVREA